MMNMETNKANNNLAHLKNKMFLKYYNYNHKCSNDTAKNNATPFRFFYDSYLLLLKPNPYSVFLFLDKYILDGPIKAKTRYITDGVREYNVFSMFTEFVLEPSLDRSFNIIMSITQSKILMPYVKYYIIENDKIIPHSVKTVYKEYETKVESYYSKAKDTVEVKLSSALDQITDTTTVYYEKIKNTIIFKKNDY